MCFFESSEAVVRTAAWLACLAVLVPGCAVSLDDGSTSTPPDDASVPRVRGCPLLRDEAHGVLGATGRVSVFSRSLPDGESTWIVADSLELASGASGNSITPAVLENGHLDAASCLSGGTLPAAPALDVMPLGDDVTGRILSVVALADSTVAYVGVSRGLESVGVALARWDERRAAFVTSSEYLFTGDRPQYGDAALVSAGYVYAYGCKPSGFLRDACYVARVAVADVGERTRYQHYRAGGGFAADPDLAWPIFSGGRGLSVVALGGRFLAAYVTPLGTTITLRQGLGPTGPWSDAIPVASCDVPSGAFCTTLSVLLAVPHAEGELPIAYGVGSFDTLTLDERRSRLALVALPPAR